ncbi:aldolase/citrate lyase family protein [Phyllobacterium sp. UNC302MFCol5.2]|uniref:HpcH/HpaI aldolase family protein n=1 Tax=Phyllobacterium sp. UNC302MFCol5.2 TaxID=1449065 RepID=UPI000689DD21|nr:aldolase/citrate lyase family protein [Phyllobacterium sp. UNC302MFCol5.2]
MNTMNIAGKIRSRETTFGIWMSIPHPIVAETLAHTTADFLLVDGEHAPIPPDSLMQILPATERHGMPVIYRVQGKSPELIKAALDHGVNGVMVPMINSAEEAQKCVAAAKYPPLGIRGAGAWRASKYYMDQASYLSRADAETVVVLQIESKDAIGDIEAISKVKGVDALYVGPADLSLSLGVTLGELHPELLAACRRVADAAKRNGVVAGIDIVSLDFIPAFYALGFTLFTYGGDAGFVIEGGRAAMADARAQCANKH